MRASPPVLGALQRFGLQLPPRDKVHTFSRLKLIYATDLDLKRIGLTLESSGRLRNAADYQLSVQGPFVSAKIAMTALADAQRAFDLLNAIEADPARHFSQRVHHTVIGTKSSQDMHRWHRPPRAVHPSIHMLA